MTVKPDSSTGTPEAQLQTFIDRFDQKGQKLMRAVRNALRKQFPAANELAYDYNHSVVIAYSATERGIDAIVSISLLADGVRLYFMHGPQLPDPKRLLQGSAKQVRFIQVTSAAELAHTDVKALIDAASDLASTPMPSAGKGSLIIKSKAAKKRSQRTPAPVIGETIGEG